LIEHGINGLVLNDFNNVDELAELMRSLAADRAFARKLGQAGRVTAEQYSWDIVAARTMEVYRQVSTGQPAVRPSLRRAGLASGD
jgi:glycosyltransferase involved in cell wall biosynthesis